MTSIQNSNDLQQLATLAAEHRNHCMDEVFKRQWFKSTIKKQMQESVRLDDTLAVNSLLILSYKGVPNKWELAGLSVCSRCTAHRICFRLVPTKRKLCVHCWVIKSDREELLHVVMPIDEFTKNVNNAHMELD